MGKAGLLSVLMVVTAMVWALPACGAEPARDQAAKQAPQPIDDKVTQGALRVRQEDGSVVECPLKHTDVTADISGFIARVKVTQTFHNPFKDKIEAVYVFPLPHGSAVDDMTMVIGERRIVGLIRKRDVARAIYEQAIARGQTAALLEQERPNIFVQSVGNINPGQEIRIEISYLDVLEYDMGEYTFHFPMVVGPRFNPPGSTGGIGAVPVGAAGASGQKTEVEYLKPGQRNGHDISLGLTLDAGVPVRDIRSTNHKAEVIQVDATRATAKLLPGDSIPNKDFVLKYKVAGEKPEMALLAHNPGYGSGGYFMLMIQPRLDEELKKAPPREVCFLIDVSGSMSGKPTQQVKRTMQEFFKLSKPDDTIQVVTFAGQAKALFDHYVPATRENVEKALDFTRGIRGGGGTMMLEGIKKVVEEPVAPDRIRIVIMLTDGYIGNEKQIIDEVDRRCGDQIRFWAVGIGNSVNRFLIDGVARQGGGMGKVLGLNDDPAELVPQIVERIHRAQLASIQVDWKGLGVYDIYPMRIPELWAGRPVVLYGRFYEPGRDVITIRGLIEGKPVSYPLQVELPAEEPDHAVLAQVWARKKIEDLSYQMMGTEVEELVEEITNTALTYRLMSQYTSFVAVDEQDMGKLRGPAKPPRRVSVPVPVPDGVSFAGVFGPDEEVVLNEAFAATEEREAFAFDHLAAPRAADSARKAYYGATGGGFIAEKAKGARAEQAAVLPLAAPAKPPMALALGNRRSGAAAGVARGLRMQNASAKMRALEVDEAWAKWSEAAGSGRAATGADDKALDKMLKVDYRNKPLADVLKSLSKASGTKIVLDEDIREAAGKARVYIRSSGNEVPLRVALGWIKQRTGYDFTVRDGVVHLHKGVWQLAEECRQAGAKAEEAGNLADAAAQFRKACMLAMSDADYRSRNIAQMAISDLLRAREALVKKNIDSLPGLGKQLDLVLEHTSLEEAIPALSKAAGIELSVIDGSLDDARELLQVKALDVVYLDLRNATVAEALCWLLDPFQLDWAVDGKRILIGTSRRMPGDTSTPWVYSIAGIVLPTKDEFGDDKQANRQLVIDSRKEVLAAIRAVVDPARVKPLDLGRVLVEGTAADHRKVGAVLAFLRTGKQEGVPVKEAAEIAARTARRYAARAELRARRIAANEQAAVAEALNDYSWKLMAGALAGTTDAEALAWLQYAWNHAECANALAAGPALSARALWAVAASARLLPKDAAVQALAKRAAEIVPAPDVAASKGRGVQGAAELLEYKPAPGSRLTCRGVQGAAELLEYALAARDLAALGIKSSLGEELAATVMALAQERDDWPAPAAFALLDNLDAKRRAELAGKLEKAAPSVRGDDAMVLYALACRRVGGEAWARYRSDIRVELIRQTRPGGDALLITNRLSSPSLALVK